MKHIGLALILLFVSGCPLRVDPPPPSSCLRQPNCGQCASHSTTAEEGSTSLESGRFCVWCLGDEPGCFPEGHECASAVSRLEECGDE